MTLTFSKVYQNYLSKGLTNEKLTKKEIFDICLKQADWNVSDRTQVIEEFDIHLTISEAPATPYAGLPEQLGLSKALMR
jgi:hypothetical protein